ncbi:MAG: hypothetical protein IPK07_14220 [Deltaproteobacteria bacterium]|nr:hypothetical protein [Deltaproteobacteria bacterium]
MKGKFDEAVDQGVSSGIEAVLKIAQIGDDEPDKVRALRALSDKFAEIKSISGEIAIIDDADFPSDALRDVCGSAFAINDPTPAVSLSRQSIRKGIVSGCPAIAALIVHEVAHHVYAERHEQAVQSAFGESEEFAESCENSVFSQGATGGLHGKCEVKEN